MNGQESLHANQHNCFSLDGRIKRGTSILESERLGIMSPAKFLERCARYLVAACPVDPRTRSVDLSSICRGFRSVCSSPGRSDCNSKSTAAFPISYVGCPMVVRLGLTTSAQSAS